ncbi:hypothetical protein EX30DRAFT_184918 [Ascodesmis nigricans]|uniref:Uncharacterized protein n=1 Tax=Ascodesmis nigricans TaxID=341454 RepID=A0A4S2N088_9PEZI|nr:hypothetical protein EX30DRAFT_184918 [Ascodesmis nigricans]
MFRPEILKKKVLACLVFSPAVYRRALPQYLLLRTSRTIHRVKWRYRREPYVLKHIVDIQSIRLIPGNGDGQHILSIKPPQ